jgi:hypothetical protein
LIDATYDGGGYGENPYNPPIGDPLPGYQWVWDDARGGWVQAPDPAQQPAPTIDPPGGVDPGFTAAVNPPPPEPEPEPVSGGNPYVSAPAPSNTAAPPSAPVPGPSAPSGAVEPFFPSFQPPSYERPGNFAPPPAFSYADFKYDAFKAPSLDDAKNEPGYAFSAEQGRKALENSAAARGVLRTGGTLKDLFQWGNKFAEQNYGNVYNRAADSYDRNRGNAFGQWAANRDNAANTYATNYGVSRDTFDRNKSVTDDANAYAYKSASDAFNANFRAKELTFDDIYRRWKTLVDTQTQLAYNPPQMI